MRFLKNYPYTSQQKSIDIALIVALVPIFFLLKVGMQLYIVVALIFIIKNLQKLFWYLFAFGLVGLSISFFNSISYIGLSTLNIFVEIVISALIWAISLQRLRHEINFYITISPFLLLVLSLFYYTNLSILFYTIFEIFIFIVMIVWNQTKQDLLISVRESVVLFFISIPIVVLLFIIFPRISFKNADFGFKSDSAVSTGHDGLMYVDDKALLVPSEKVVMEVEFQERPTSLDLYFRGSTLYINKGNRWLPEAMIPQRVPLQKIGRKTDYKITLYPNKHRFLYALDMPLTLLENSVMSRDFIITSKSDIKSTFKYTMKSALGYAYFDDKISPSALDVNQSANPKTRAFLTTLNDLNDTEKLHAIERWLQKAHLKYSLKPKPLNLTHMSDSLLFEQKVGYCVHYASAMSTLFRLANLPSRIVTGYKSDPTSSVGNYIVIKEKDAHSWNEVYIKSRGWMRFDATEYTIIDDSLAENRALMQNKSSALTLYMMYLKYKIEDWVLNYTYLKQQDLIRELLSNALLLIKLIFAIAVVILIGVLIFLYLKDRSCKTPEECLLKKLLRKLAKKGFEKDESETLHHFLSRLKDSNIAQIDRLYHQIAYSNHKEGIDELKRRINAL